MDYDGATVAAAMSMADAMWDMMPNPDLELPDQIAQLNLGRPQVGSPAVQECVSGLTATEVIL